MFIDASWFQPASRPLGLKPRTWQGKAYLTVWAVILAAPTALLAFRGQWLETPIWLGFTSFVPVIDLRDLRRQRRSGSESDDLLYITEHSANRAMTEKYELERKG